ncbi:hypothetical protein [Noviluteimonas gilva]|uniref:Uncharacterized protein n=1 Tax=Noviluteimonas gilva TaxID=2682097 RepID=A0A7C9M239_9GAMM|nr:hypothetical protein [Lysobacter gilvus]MUV13486.1 hypothetical protein [Lysobacter gilvus]
MSEVEGTLQSLLGSLQSHFTDRLKSPFGGAFIVAWLAVNWKAILILAFSDTSIEARTFLTSSFYLTQSNVLWKPLAYACLGVLGYYAIATVFVAFYEVYGLMRRWVERKFDSYRWVDPTTYIATKKATNKQISELSELASDRMDRVEELQAAASLAEAGRKEAEGKLQLSVAEVAELADRYAGAQDSVISLRSSLAKAEKNESIADQKAAAAKTLALQLEEIAQRLSHLLETQLEPPLVSIATLKRPDQASDKLRQVEELKAIREKVSKSLANL